MSWTTLKVNHNYEISPIYPYPIRRKDDKHIAKVGMRNDGCQRVYLDKVEHLKHIVVATQWLPNPKNLPQVDHKNRNRSDNHLSNLHWVTYSENNYNRDMPKHHK